jgi:hypothetical protein
MEINILVGQQSQQLVRQKELAVRGKKKKKEDLM